MFIVTVSSPSHPLPSSAASWLHLEAVQERLKALKEAQAATEAELKRLEQAILEKAFRGEL
jgi:type I restriction enzyme S subunit